MPRPNKDQALVSWGYGEEKITPREFIRRITPLITGPVSNMRDCDGDMWISDYAKLGEAADKLERIKEGEF